VKKEKIDKLDFTKIKQTGYQRTEQRKVEFKEWKNIFESHISDKGHIIWIY
jgi:hypothetical protein